MTDKTLLIKILIFIFLFSLAFLHYAPKTNSDKEISLSADNKKLFSELAHQEQPADIQLESEGTILQKIQSLLKESMPVLSSEEQQRKTDAAPAPSEEKKSADGFTVVMADSLIERPIDIKSVVATQCVWDYAVPENVFEDPRFHAQTYVQGSGVIISPAGHILTASHVIDSDLASKPDPAGRKWFLKKCQAAFTENAAPLSYDSPRFKDVEISFQPSAEERAEFDFAVLKFKEGENYPFTAFFDMLADYDLEEKTMLLAGYPAAALTGKRELKTIEFFSDLEKFQWGDAEGSALFYQAGSRQYQAASESYKKFQQELFDSGQDGRLVRGGFSGSPVFLKGYLVGITISSSLPYAESQDVMLVLSSYSIAELLKKYGLL